MTLILDVSEELVRDDGLYNFRIGVPPAAAKKGMCPVSLQKEGIREYIRAMHRVFVKHTFPESTCRIVDHNLGLSVFISHVDEDGPAQLIVKSDLTSAVATMFVTPENIRSALDVWEPPVQIDFKAAVTG